MVSSNKGQTAFDLILVLVVFFILGLAALFGNMLVSDLNDDIQNDDTFGNESKQTAQAIDDNYSNWFDAAFLAIIIFLWVMLLVTSFLIDAHPIFFIIAVVLLLAVMGVGMMLSNAYQEITDDALLSTFAADFPMTNFIMNNMLLVLIVIGFTASLALYAKQQ